MITSMVARFSGIVTYDDNTTGSFHTQSERDIVWSVNQDSSVENLKQISWFEPTPSNYPYWSAIGDAIDNLPFLGFAWDTDHPTTQKTITDMVAKVEFLFTTEDKIYSVAVIVTGTEDDIRIELPDLITGSANLAEFKTKIRTMFLNVMEVVTVS